MKQLRQLYLTMALLAVLVWLVPVAVLASDVSNALYRMTITVSNNASAAASGVSVNVSVSSPNLIAGGYANTGVTDVAMRDASDTDIPFMPGNGTNPWMFWVDAITGNAYDPVYLYTANSTGGDINMFLGAAGMTITDAPTMEPSGNFTVELSGYLDMAVSDNAASKDGAFRITTDAATANVTAYLPGATTNITLRPEGVGDLTALSLFGAATNWQAVLTNDADTSFVYIGAPYVTDTYATTNGTVPSTAVIAGVEVHNVSKWETGAGGEVKTAVRLGGTTVVSGAHVLTNAYVDYSDNLTRPGGGDWTVADIPNLQIGTSLQHSGANQARTTEVYAIIWYYPPPVTVTGVTSGEKAITVNYVSDNQTYPTTAMLSVGGGATGFNPAQLVDGNTGTAGFNFPGTVVGAFVTMDFGASGKALDGLRVNAADGGNPGTWKVQRSSDNITWTDVYTPWAVNITPATWVEATWNYTGSYRYWRLYVSVAAAGLYQVNELQYYARTLALTVGSSTTTVGTYGVPVAGNANNWVIDANYVMPYLEYFKFYQGGNLKSHIRWNYGATFTDLSGNGNHATPTFRTTSSDPDVSAAPYTFQPITEAKAPSWVLSSNATDWISTPALSGNFTTNVTSTFPGANIIAAIAAATGTPSQLPFTILTAFIILAISLTISYAMRQHSQGSIFIKSMIIAMFMGIAIATHTIDFWMLIYFAIFATAFSIGSQHKGGWET